MYDMSSTFVSGVAHRWLPDLEGIVLEVHLDDELAVGIRGLRRQIG